MKENVNVFRAKPIQGYYHICSDGNRVDILFKNEKDFIAAMNRVATITLRMKVIILAFVLMDNHFHFVIKADSEEDAIRFANEFKRLTGKYNADMYGDALSLSRLPVKVIPVPDEDYLKTLVVYVIKNPTKARIEMFYTYPWGTGGLYFRGGRQEKTIPKDRPGVRFLKKTCRTHLILPTDWRVSDGMITPESYVAVDLVEHLFKTPRSYMYYLSLNKDDDMEKELGEWNEINLSDSELRAERVLMTREHFGTRSLRDLSAPDRLKLARMMRKRFLCPKKQLARIVQLPYETVRQML